MTRSTPRALAWAVALVAVVGLGGCKPKPGAACKGSGHAQCNGKQTALVCDDGTWHELACRGPAGCAELSSRVTCDQDEAHVDDLCLDEGSPACSADRKQVLQCKGKRFVFDVNCLGPKGCSASGSTVECDTSLAQIGDPCGEGSACALDGKSLLRCQGGKWAVEKACKQGCTVAGNTIECR